MHLVEEVNEDEVNKNCLDIFETKLEERKESYNIDKD